MTRFRLLTSLIFCLAFVLLAQAGFAQGLIGQMINGSAAGARFGASVSLSETAQRLAVAAPANGAGGSDQPTVTVYELQNGTWVELLPPFTDLAPARDVLEISVDLNETGDALAIGNPSFPVSGNADAGRITTHNLANGTWSARATPITGTYADAQLGRDVRFTPAAEQVTSGAYGGGTGDTRGAIPFLLSGSTYSSVVANPLLVAFGDQAVNCVAAGRNGLRVAIGYQQNNTVAKVEVQQFQTGTGAWVSGGTLSGETVGDGFGNEIATSVNGLTLGVGAPLDGNGAGYVKVFDSDRNQVGNRLAGGAGIGRFGHAIAMSENGTIMIVGAPNTGTGTGVAIVYELENTTWVEIARFTGVGASDETGYAVDMTPDGNIVAVGRPGVNGGAGRVEVYDLRISSTQELDFDLPVSIGPNPTRNELVIQGETQDIQAVRIFDQQGRLVVETPFTSNHIAVDRLPAGSYHLQLVTPEGVARRSFVKQ